VTGNKPVMADILLVMMVTESEEGKHDINKKSHFIKVLIL
jgi:hypothetical protein